MTEATTPSLMTPSLARVSWLMTRIQVLLSLILAVMVGLSISRLGWGNAGHVVKADFYPLLALSYLSLIYVLVGGIFFYFSWCMFQYHLPTNIGFIVMDAVLGVGLAVSCSWIASGVGRPPGPGTENYAAHTTCGPYQKYINDLSQSNYTYEEYQNLSMQASNMLGSCMADMTAYCIGFILSVTYLTTAMVRFKLWRKVIRRTQTLDGQPPWLRSPQRDPETASTAQTLTGQVGEDKM